MHRVPFRVMAVGPRAAAYRSDAAPLAARR
jgi:hypothetical protein